MESVPCWRLLSDEERANCTGDLRDFPCCSKYAWNVKGKLQSDWNDRVQPQIICLIRHNHKQVFGKSGIQVPWVLQLYLLSSTRDPTTASPTITILTADKRVASRMRKLIIRHDIFKNLDTGFDVLYEGKSIFTRAGDTGDAGLPWSSNLLSLCGAPVIVTPHSTQPHDDCRRATIFCVVKVRHHHFAILPAHVFETADGRDGTSNNHGSTQDTPTAPDSGSESSNCSDDSGYQGSDEISDGSVESFATSIPSKHALYLDISASSVEISELTNQKPLGHFDASQQFDLCGLTYETSREYDYALVKLDAPDWIRWNSVPISATDHLPVENYTTSTPHGEVLIATGSRGVHQVHSSGTAATLMLPGSQGPQLVWEVQHTLGQGDSGSIVLNHAGEMVGMAVATIPSYNVTYIVPAQTIFEDIYINANAVDVEQYLDPHIVSRACLSPASITAHKVKFLSQSIMSQVGSRQAEGFCTTKTSHWSSQQHDFERVATREARSASSSHEQLEVEQEMQADIREATQVDRGRQIDTPDKTLRHHSGSPPLTVSPGSRSLSPCSSFEGTTLVSDNDKRRTRSFAPPSGEDDPNDKLFSPTEVQELVALCLRKRNVPPARLIQRYIKGRSSISRLAISVLPDEDIPSAKELLKTRDLKRASEHYANVDESSIDFTASQGSRYMAVIEVYRALAERRQVDALEADQRSNLLSLELQQVGQQLAETTMRETKEKERTASLRKELDKLREELSATRNDVWLAGQKNSDVVELRLKKVGQTNEEEQMWLMLPKIVGERQWQQDNEKTWQRSGVKDRENASPDVDGGRRRRWRHRQRQYLNTDTFRRRTFE